MIRYHEEIGKLSPTGKPTKFSFLFNSLKENFSTFVSFQFITDLGRTASHFYVKYDTIEIFNNLLQQFMSEPETLNMLAQATEFEQLKV